jgi:hypothetical protein
MGLWSIESRPCYRAGEHSSSGHLELVLAPVVVGSVAVDIGLGGRAEVRAYAKRLVDFANQLDADARTQIVYADTSTLDDIAKDYGEGTLPSSSELAKRAAARGSAQTKKDLEWANRWHKFYVSLLAYQAQIEGFDFDGPSVTTAWANLQGFDAKLRELHAEYAALGGTAPSETLPETFTTPSGKPDPENATASALSTAAKAAGALAIAIGGYALVKAWRG